MIKKLQKNKFLILAFIGLLSFQMNAQVIYEFTNTASGTDVFVPTNFTVSQGKHTVTLTTNGTADPELNTTALGLVAGADATIPAARRIIGITLRVSSGGPDFLRISHPNNTAGTGRHITNLSITKGTDTFQTYFLDLAASTAYQTDWTGTENDIKITFRNDDSTGTGAANTSTGETVEIDRIEFVHNAWKGGAPNNRWGNSGNWVFSKPGTKPSAALGIAEDVLIPSAVEADINVNILDVHSGSVSGGQSVANSISLGAGAKLTNTFDSKNVNSQHIYFGIGSVFLVNGTSNVSGVDAASYKMEMPDTNWHLVTSPVVGAQHDNAWVAANDIEEGTDDTDNRGISTYNNTSSNASTGHWRYFKATPGTAVTFFNFNGSGIKRKAKGVIEFVGTGIRANPSFDKSISQGVTNWNLIGSQYTSHLNATSFVADNVGIFPTASQAIYVWNGTTYTSVIAGDGDLKVGQAFFMNNDSGATDAIFNLDKHSIDVDNSAVFYRNSETKVTLSLTSANKTLNTYVSYLGNKTKDLNPGFDISLFNGVSSNLSIYTHLLENNEGINFERQALPNTGLESMVIPVGVKAEAGKEIVFSAEASNLPSGLKVFLEDRLTNTFTRLDEANTEYKITLTDAVYGVGRFYLYTTQSALSLDDASQLNSISIYKTNSSTLKIAGLQQGKASVSLFNIQGKQILTTAFEANGVKEISLPNLASGVYLVQLTTEAGKLNKKIILE